MYSRLRTPPDAQRKALEHVGCVIIGGEHTFKADCPPRPIDPTLVLAH